MAAIVAAGPLIRRPSRVIRFPGIMPSALIAKLFAYDCNPDGILLNSIDPFLLGKWVDVSGESLDAVCGWELLRDATIEDVAGQVGSFTGISSCLMVWAGLQLQPKGLPGALLVSGRTNSLFVGRSNVQVVWNHGWEVVHSPLIIGSWKQGDMLFLPEIRRR